MVGRAQRTETVHMPKNYDLSRRTLLKAAGGAAALSAIGLGTASPAHAASNGFGLTITDHAVFGGRMHYYRFATNEISWDPGVNVLLPDDYFTSTRR